MNIAYFDCFSGVSGDMMLGALIDIGLNKDKLSTMLEGLGLKNFSLESEVTKRGGIEATNLHVRTEAEKNHRHLSDILDIIRRSELSAAVKTSIEQVFTRIAEAEGKIHGQPPDKVYFHEVGALDSIIDITGSVWGLEELGVTHCYSSAISLGSGTVECAHGVIPVPAPATVEIVKNFPVRKMEVGNELCTPTGAALVTSLAEYCEQLPLMKIENVGYGCGDRELENMPNIFRILIGTPSTSYEHDRMLLVETNIDDMSSEIIPYVFEQLLGSGAVDVFTTANVMKKGRPGHIISLLTSESLLDTCLEILFKETTTLGVRISEVYRRKLPRKMETLQSPWGPVKVKSVIRQGKRVILPEFEECKKIAEKEKISLDEVFATIRKLGAADDHMS
ncbi:nickel pincer cofactor biosynthesis protein LarC [candidate division KSB1 bacterium]